MQANRENYISILNIGGLHLWLWYTCNHIGTAMDMCDKIVGSSPGCVKPKNYTIGWLESG